MDQFQHPCMLRARCLVVSGTCLLKESRTTHHLEALRTPSSRIITPCPYLLLFHDSKGISTMTDHCPLKPCFCSEDTAFFFPPFFKKKKNMPTKHHIPCISTTTTYPDRYSLFICHPAAICIRTKLRLSHTVIITAYIQDPLCTVY